MTPFDNFITDSITITKSNGSFFDLKCSFQKQIMINGIEDRIDEGDKILRKVGNKYIDYIITKIEYTGVGQGIMESTNISYSRPGNNTNNGNVSNNIGTVILNGGSFSISNSGNISVNQNNEAIDQLIELINQKDIEHKSQIINLLEQYQKTQDNSKIKEIFDYIGNVSGLGQFLLAGFQTIYG